MLFRGYKYSQTQELMWKIYHWLPCRMQLQQYFFLCLPNSLRSLFFWPLVMNLTYTRVCFRTLLFFLYWASSPKSHLSTPGEVQSSTLSCTSPTLNVFLFLFLLYLHLQAPLFNRLWNVWCDLLLWGEVFLLRTLQGPSFFLIWCLAQRKYFKLAKVYYA